MNNRSLSDFYNTEYKQQAQNANFTKLSNIFGLKVTANKVAHTAIQKKITAWQKVEVVSSVTALETLYMGGSANIDGVIVNMATSYVGSNNYPIMDSKGDFGGRLNSVSAASRYIFTRMHPNFDKIFNKEDLNILPRYNFEGQDIEYQFLTFNVPLILVNGGEGMGSGHAQKIFPTKLEDTITYIKSYLSNGKETPLPVYYNGFTGSIKQGENINQWVITGRIKRVNNTTTEILEVPVSESYKSYIKKLDALLEKGVIKSYDDLCDPKTDTFYFKVKHSSSFGNMSDEEIINELKLVSTDSENYTVIDENNAVKVFSSRTELMNYYIELKLVYLDKRKAYMLEKIQKDIDIDQSKLLFIKNIVDDKLIINKRSKSDIEKDVEKIDGIVKRDGNYDYLLGMSISTLTKERMASLTSSINDKKKELKTTQSTSITDMWLSDLTRI